MASISVNFGASDAYTVAVEWAVAAQDTAQNQTTLDLTCTLRSNRASATFTGQARSDTLTIGGQSYACNHGAYTVPGGGSVTLWTLRAAVSHDADGSFSKAVACTVGIGTTFSSSGYIDAVTASGTMTLPAIPRASTLSAGAFTAGSAGTIAIQAASSAFTHNLSYTFGGKSGSIASGVKGSVSWTPPLSLLTEIPSATQGSGTLTCTTLLNGAAVGTKTAAFPLYAPDSVRPTVTAAEVAVVNDNAVAADWGVAIRGLSKLRWSAAASGAYGSTVRSWAFACGGVTGSASSGTTAVLPAAGTFIPAVTVTDSRGRTGSRSAAAVEVLDYAPPVVKTASAVRCDGSGAASDQGTCCRLNLTASCSSVGGRNSLTLRCRTKPTGGTFSGWTALTDGMVLPGFALGQSYAVELSAVDALGGERTVSVSVPTAAAAFHIREGGQGAGFGKYAEEDNLLDVGWNIRSRGCIETDERLRAGYGIELGHNLKNNIGGYLDFHYNGSDSDYTSRIIETEAGKLQVYGDLSVSGKLNGLYIKAGSKVFQTAATNAIPVFTSDDLNTLFGTSGVAWGMSNSVCFFANGAWEAQRIPVCAACNHNVWNMVSANGANFGDGSWFRVNYLAIGWT